MENIKAYIIRLQNVMLMHETILSMSNENAYFSWIYRMPDEPTIEDFNDFAEDEEEYMELYLYFNKLFSNTIPKLLFSTNSKSEVNNFISSATSYLKS